MDQNKQKRPYQPPVVEDVPIDPKERLLAPCKGNGETSPFCFGTPCNTCSAVGS